MAQNGFANATKTETAMRVIFGFLGALLLKDLFSSISAIMDRFFKYGLSPENWWVIIFLIVVLAWIFRSIYGTALELLYAQEIIKLPLAGKGKQDNLKVLFWRFWEFASFIIIFHIVNIVTKLSKAESFITELPIILKEFTFDILILCAMWLIWRLIYNHLINNLPSEKDGNYPKKEILSLCVVCFLFLIFRVSISFVNVSIPVLILILIIISVVYVYLEFFRN